MLAKNEQLRANLLRSIGHDLRTPLTAISGEQLRANLLRSIGHDLRTPLTAISGSAAVLRDGGKKLGDAKRLELADAIYDDSLWLIDTVENLLAITRIEDADMQLSLTSELMDEVIAAALAALSHVARESHGHRVTITHTDEILLVKIDVHLIMQVLTNLITNAFKYTPEGSTVTIGARREGSSVVVEVADDGPGVSDRDKPHVFDRFFIAGGPRPVDSHRSENRCPPHHAGAHEPHHERVQIYAGGLDRDDRRATGGFIRRRRGRR